MLSPGEQSIAATIESIGKTKSNRQLLFWMFRFLSPVKPLAFLACFYLAAGVALEQLAVLQTGKVVDHISNHLRPDEKARASGPGSPDSSRCAGRRSGGRCCIMTRRCRCWN